MLILLFVSSPQIALAHPGRTASDGCHFCRTNCDKWGEVWNARHCHGGYTTPVNTPRAQVATSAPTKAPTVKPTITPTAEQISTPSMKPTVIPTPTSTTTVKPEVIGESDEEREQTPIVESSSSDYQSIGGLLGIVGLSGIGYYLFKRFKK